MRLRRHPDRACRYLRTDHSVVLVACPACKAIKGEPCMSRQGYSGGTHSIRRVAAKAHLRSMSLPAGTRVDDLIVPVEPHAPEPSLPPDPTAEVEYAPIPRIVIRPRSAQPIKLLNEPRPL